MNRPPDPAPRFKIWVILTLLAWIAIVLAYQYVQTVERPVIEARRQLQMQILAGEAEMPYQARLLAPVLSNFFEQGLKVFTGGDTFMLGYACYDALAIFLSLATLFFYLRHWFNDPACLLGVLISAVSMLVGFRDHYFQPWSLLEPAILGAGLWLVWRKKFWLLAILVFVGTFNRETTLLLVGAYFLSWLPLPRFWQAFRPEYRKMWVWGIGLLGLWALVFGGLAWVYRDLPRTISVDGILAENLKPANLMLTLRQWVLFLGVFWIFIGLGYRKSPSFVRRMSGLLLLYLVFLLPYALWFEVRLLMTVYPVLIPLGLAGFGVEAS